MLNTILVETSPIQGSNNYAEALLIERKRTKSLDVAYIPLLNFYETDLKKPSKNIRTAVHKTSLNDSDDAAFVFRLKAAIFFTWEPAN